MQPCTVMRELLEDYSIPWSMLGHDSQHGALILSLLLQVDAASWRTPTDEHGVDGSTRRVAVSVPSCWVARLLINFATGGNHPAQRVRRVRVKEDKLLRNRLVYQYAYQAMPPGPAHLYYHHTPNLRFARRHRRFLRMPCLPLPGQLRSRSALGVWAVLLRPEEATITLELCRHGDWSKLARGGQN